MIVRVILTDRSVLKTFDFFNDGKDTFAWLLSLRTPQANRAARALQVAMNKWIARNRARRIAVLLAVILASLAAHAIAQERVSVHLTMGNPSRAKADESERGNFLVVTDEYCYSYNTRTGLANWVAWRLAGDDVGDADRTGIDFSEDDRLPAKYPRPAVKLYNGSGFDKGHVLPSKDRSRRAKGQKATFKLANCMPQAPKLNRGPWKEYEEHRRQLAADGKELYVYAGPAGRGGQGEKGFSQSLGRPLPAWDSLGIESDGFDVPAWCWAVCVVLDEKEGNDLVRVKEKTPAGAVLMPNIQTIEGPWRKHQVRIRDVEDLTGLNFFNLVDDDVQEAIETESPREP